jgi:hypothetical protein
MFGRSGKKSTGRIGSVVVMAIMAAVASPAIAQVTYSLDLFSELLDADYYSGVAKNGVEASSAGRGAYAPASNWQGTQVAFYGLNLETFALDIYVVDIGDPASWRRVAPPGVSGTQTGVRPPITYSVSGKFIFVDGQRITASTGENAGIREDIIGDLSDGVQPVLSAHLGIQPSGTILGGGIWPSSNTGGAFSDNLVGFVLDGDAEQIPGTDAGLVTFFPVSAGVVLESALWSPDGDKITFIVRNFTSSTLGIPDVSSVYVLNGVQAIMASGLGANSEFTTAPTSLADSRISLIRGNGGGESSFKAVPFISQDNSVMVWSEDFSDTFASFDQATSFGTSDFDPVLANVDNTTADGANSLNDVRYADNTNNFLITGTTPGGLRILFYTDAGQVNSLLSHILIGTFVAQNAVPQTPPATTGDTLTDSNGDPVTVPDDTTTDTVQVTTATMATDPAGTEVALPMNQVIVFPEGQSTISIVTPTDPVQDAVIPAAQDLVLPAGVTEADVTNLAIPIVRTFEPSGTMFFPPVEVTINYSDAEVAGLADESQLLPILFNEATGLFDIILDPADVTFRDVNNNIIKFNVDHFSTYGLGAASAVGAPQSETSYTMLILLLAFAGVAYLMTAKLNRDIRKS